MLDAIGFFAGLVLVYKAGSHIESMRLHTNHFIRFAYWAIAVGGAALVFVPFAHAEDNWLRPAGWTGVVVGLALLFLFDRRPALEEESQRIRQ